MVTGVAIVIATTFLFIIYTNNIYHSNGTTNLLYKDVLKYQNGELKPNYFDPYVINREYTLDLEDEDVIVFLHIQKTGGSTFGRHLVRNLDTGLGKPCTCVKGIKRCDCRTPKKNVMVV